MQLHMIGQQDGRRHNRCWGVRVSDEEGFQKDVGVEWDSWFLDLLAVSLEA